MKFSNRDFSFYMAGVITGIVGILLTRDMGLIPLMLTCSLIGLVATFFLMFLFRDKP